MKTVGRIVVLLSPLFLAAPAVALWPWTPRPPEEPLTVTPAEPSASVIADELDMRHWSYRLQFHPPVKNCVGFDLCELKRKPDGSWEKTLLAKGARESRGVGYKDVTLHVLIYEGKEGPKFSYWVVESGSATGSHRSLKKMPDFKDMTLLSDGRKIINGCIVLGAQHKNPDMWSDNEADWARVIGLEMKTEPMP
jgi:hypothetical protein